MATGMSAAELVKLADKGVAEAQRLTGWDFDFIGYTVYVTTLGNAYVVSPTGIPPSSVLISAPLTPENVASPLALKRALVASAVTVEKRDGFFIAYLDDDHFSDTHYTEAEARDTLLDALLASPPPKDNA